MFFNLWVPVGHGLVPLNTTASDTVVWAWADCIQRVPTTWTRSSVHRVGGLPTLRYPVYSRSSWLLSTPKPIIKIICSANDVYWWCVRFFFIKLARSPLVRHMTCTKMCVMLAVLCQRCTDVYCRCKVSYFNFYTMKYWVEKTFQI